MNNINPLTLNLLQTMSNQALEDYVAAQVRWVKAYGNNPDGAAYQYRLDCALIVMQIRGIK